MKLAIYQELSSIQNTLTAAQGGIITNKRSFESMVLVEDGNIVVLGGLIEDKTDNSKSSVPVLGSIPLLGQLFRYESRKRTKTNLLVFLRPYVVRDEATSSALAMDRYDYIRGQVANSTLADNIIFRDLQSRQLPEKPPVAPSLKRAESGPRTLSNDLAPGIPAQDPPRQTPAPIIDVAPSAPQPAAPATPPPAAPPPSSSAPGAAAGAAAPSSGTFSAQPGTAPSSTGAQLLQVASMTDIARAREMQRSLRDAGFDAYWESVKTSAGDMVRVRVSVDQATQSMATTIARLKALGYDPVIVTP